MRDAAGTIDVALRSVLRQRESQWECIVVDDGSTDDSRERVRRHALRDPRIRLVEGSRQGLVPSLLLGVAECRAPLIARMDADDWMHRDRLGLQMACFASRPQLGALGAHVRLFPRSALGPGIRSYEQWINGLQDAEALTREAFIECPIAHPTLMIRAEVLERFPYRDMGWPEDYDLVLRLLAAGTEVDILPRRLLGWRHGPNRHSQQSPTYRAERFTACKAAFLATGFLGARDQYILWGYGGTGRHLRKALLEQGRHAAWILELHPGRVGNRIHGAPVVPPEGLRDLPSLPLLVSVAGHGPRNQIRQQLTAWGRIEGRDYLCTA